MVALIDKTADKVERLLGAGRDQDISGETTLHSGRCAGRSFLAKAGSLRWCCIEAPEPLFFQHVVTGSWNSLIGNTSVRQPASKI